MSIKSAKQLCIINLPCGGQFPKTEITERLIEQVQKESNENGQLQKKITTIDFDGPNGGYEKALERLNINQYKNYVLVGWSMGGAAALMLANQFDNIDGIVLLGASSNGYKLNNLTEKKLKILQIHNKYDSVIPFATAVELYDNLNGKENKNHKMLVSHSIEGNCHQYNDVIDDTVLWIINNFVICQDK